jgi:hypothetical protein
MTGHQALEKAERSTEIRQPGEFGSAGWACNELRKPSIARLNRSFEVREVRHCHAGEAGHGVFESASLATFRDLLYSLTILPPELRSRHSVRVRIDPVGDPA